MSGSDAFSTILPQRVHAAFMIRFDTFTVPRPVPYYQGPWGYGFGHGFGFFGFLGFLLFLFLIFGFLRAVWFWGRGGPGYWHRGPGAGAPAWFEEWHRRARDDKPGTQGTTV